MSDKSRITVSYLARLAGVEEQTIWRDVKLLYSVIGQNDHKADRVTEVQH